MKSLMIALLLAGLACAPVHTPPAGEATFEGIRFSVERVPPGAMRLMLDNGTSHRLGYNLCHSALERRAGSSWEQAGTSDVCTMELRILNPGHDATFEKQLPAGLPAGEYRYVTSIEIPLGTPQRGITTEPFRH